VGREGEEFVVWAEVMGAVGWGIFYGFLTWGEYGRRWLWVSDLVRCLLGDLSLVAVVSSYPGVGVENCKWARVLSSGTAVW
jgi:hypothetical protein